MNEPVEGAPLARLVDSAYVGAAAGEVASSVEDGLLRCAVLLRPDVPMGQLVAVPPVVALGVLDGLASLGVEPGRVGIDWPAQVVLAEGGELLARVTTRAGYAEGMFVAAAVDVERGRLPQAVAARPAEEVVRGICAGIVGRAQVWERDSHSNASKAGPWAAFLPEYFDRVVLLGKPVNVCYPNGRVYARGHFVGIDIWGRATVRTKNAGEIEFPPEKFTIGPQA